MEVKRKNVAAPHLQDLFFSVIAIILSLLVTARSEERRVGKEC